MKRSPLRRRTALLSRPRRENRNDPARLAWKEPHAGWCQCGCDRFSMHLDRHHVTEAQTLRQLGREDLLWNMANSMLLDPHCHANHTSAFRRIPLPAVPEAAIAFAVDLFGSDLAAADYFSRRYQPEVPEGEQHLWRWQP